MGWRLQTGETVAGVKFQGIDHKSVSINFVSGEESYKSIDLSGFLSVEIRLTTGWNRMKMCILLIPPKWGIMGW